ncbi:MAG: transcriptional regulator GlxA family with amidase domain [Porticoccus sp.]|jgi:transcriptional regulator GlxA family with amidase domain|uniref:DJ-1/PfpI family protein n=1 Tax=Porticoccus sp. TaxID=2024853 RepID=UPI0039E51631|tara:strand:+ start:247723 stop:248424 length:702 start_codon:yes stop_codon:yes gene_type:complete
MSYKTLIGNITLLISVALFSVPSFAAEKKIGVLVYDKVLSSDVTAPAEVFGVATRKSWFSDYEVILIGVDKDAPVITTEEGIRLTVDKTIYDTPKLDALIVTSSYVMDTLFENSDLTKFLKSQAKNVSWLASNCSGAFLYAHAGLLDGYTATTWAGGEKQLQREFPKINVIEDRNVVVDRNRISSNGGIPSYQAALVLLTQMSSERKAKEVFETIQLNRLIPWSEVTRYLPEQ